MSDGIVQVAPDSTGKKIRTFEQSVSGNTVESQAISLVDPTTTANVASINSNGELSVSTPDLTASVSFTGNAQTSQLLFTSGRKSYAVELTGTWVGTVVFEMLVGSTWISTDVYSETAEAYVQSTTTNGVWWFEPLGAVQGIRVRTTAWTSGLAGGTLLASMADMNTPESNGAPGAIAPPNAVQVGGSDGTNLRAFRTSPSGVLYVDDRPADALGFYSINGRTGTYGGLSAGNPLFSMRWGDSTRLAIILRVAVNVVSTVAATAGFQTERELIIARSFTVSDTGGTAVTLTGNNGKHRTSQSTSLIATNGDMRFGQPLTAGTRTLDANPIASVLGWSATNMTGVVIGGGSSGAATTAAWAASGGGGFVDLFNAMNGQDYPIVLAQNEGIIVRIGKDAEPTSATQQTYVTVTWAEVNSY